MAAKRESTAWDLEQTRQGASSHVRVFEWDGFFPRQTSPAFPDHGDVCRCHQCK